MRLRIKDLDFERHVVVIREAKCGKDRAVMLPRSLADALRAQVHATLTVREHDRQCDVSTSMIHTHVLKVAACQTASPFDTLAKV